MDAHGRPLQGAECPGHPGTLALARAVAWLGVGARLTTAASPGLVLRGRGAEEDEEDAEEADLGLGHHSGESRCCLWGWATSHVWARPRPMFKPCPHVWPVPVDPGRAVSVCLGRVHMSGPGWVCVSRPCPPGMAGPCPCVQAGLCPHVWVMSPCLGRTRSACVGRAHMSRQGHVRVSEPRPCVQDPVLEPSSPLPAPFFTAAKH